MMMMMMMMMMLSQGALPSGLFSGGAEWGAESFPSPGEWRHRAGEGNAGGGMLGAGGGGQG
jgi:hypothetical protein